MDTKFKRFCTDRGMFLKSSTISIDNFKEVFSSHDYTDNSDQLYGLSKYLILCSNTILYNSFKNLNEQQFKDLCSFVNFEYSISRIMETNNSEYKSYIKEYGYIDMKFKIKQMIQHIISISLKKLFDVSNDDSIVDRMEVARQIFRNMNGS